jgi:hypothetical protein
MVGGSRWTWLGLFARGTGSRHRTRSVATTAATAGASTTTAAAVTATAAVTEALAAAATAAVTEALAAAATEATTATRRWLSCGKR